jgi:hypothetical protein
MKNNRLIFVLISLVVLFATCLVLASRPLVAQSTYGSIAGAVTDPSRHRRKAVAANGQ